MHVRKARVRLAALWLLLPSAVAAAPAEVRLPPGALQYGRCDAPVPRIHGQSDQAFSRRLIAWRGLRPALYGPSVVPDRVEWIAETAPQDELHLVDETTAGVRVAVEAMAAAASGEGLVVLHARSARDAEEAAALLDQVADRSAVVDVTQPPESLWLRDFAGHPVQYGSNGRARLDFQYSVDCVVDDAWSAALGQPLRVPLFVEGGNLLGDGRRCYATHVIAEHNAVSVGAASHRLANVGCAETVWLEPVPATIAHVDVFLAVGDPGVDGRPVFGVAQVDAAIDAQTHEVLERNAQILGQYGRVVRVPVSGVRPLAPVLNVLPFNGVVFVPSLTGESYETTARALQQLYPGRRLVPVPSDGLAALDGGPHCISATVPSAR